MIRPSAFRSLVDTIAVALVIASGSAVAENARPVLDDAAFATSALADQFDAALAGLPLAGARSTALPLPGATADSLASHAAARALLDRGAEVCPRGTCACDGARSDPGGCWRLRYDLVHVRIDYRREGGLFRAARVRRRLRADMSYDVIDPLDRVVRAGTFVVEIADAIPARRADELASPFVPRREIPRSYRLLQGIAAVALIAALALAAR